MEGEVNEDALEQLQSTVVGREQVIMVRDETSAEQPLFAGVIRTAGLIPTVGLDKPLDVPVIQYRETD